MGQTLTHGIYLPDEGERNCYNGLAANWQLLDGAVGTVAEHTSQIAGKAPAVHTHTKSDITDFPVYGTTAGTICEGNDSRLSDARTPVAHTHGKADITDLFNSANTWTGDNTYFKPVAIERNTDTGNFLALKNTVAELGSTPAGATPVTIAFRDKDNDNLGYMGVYYDTDGSNHFRLYVRNKYTSGAPSTTGSYDYAFFGLRLNADKSKEGILKASFRPYDNNAHDLGSSSYQWNNLYAKSYYYNGTAWGLDKANTWTGNQYYTGMVILNSSSDVVEQFRQKLPKDVSTSSDALVRFNTLTDSAGHYVVIESEGHWDTYVAKSIALTYKNDSTKQGSIEFRLRSDGSGLFYAPNSFECDLGNAYNKWKTFNGVNPGALSLPDYNSYLDVTSSIPVASLDGNTQININDYLPNKTGWLSIVIDDTAGNSIIATQGRSGGSTAYNNSRTFHTGAQSNGFISVFFPILADMNKFVSIKASSLIQMRFYYCLGNV